MGYFCSDIISSVSGTIERNKIKVKKKKKDKTKIYDDDELDQESEYDSVGSSEADKMIARQICKLEIELIS